MKKEKNLIDSIGIESPCTEDWDAMTGNEKTRACSHCDFNVNDISMMTEDETLELIDDANGNLCVRYESHPVTNAPVFANKLYQISRQTGVAAGVLGASIAVSSSAVYAQKTPGNDLLKTQTTITNTNQTKTPETSNQTTTQPKAEPKPPRKIMGRMVFIRRIKNPLMLAVQQGKSLKARLMIARGADVDQIDKDYYSRTALHVAVESNDLKIAQMLLNAGAKIDVPDKNQHTPLMSVRRNTSGAILQLLARYGADLNARNRSGQTALIGAVLYENFEAVKALLEVGADVNIRDDYGYSALDHTQSEPIKQILIAYGGQQKPDKQ